MPAIYQSRWVTGQEMTAVGCNAGEVVQNLFEFPMPAAGLQIGDIIELGILPAHNRFVDALFVSDKLDGGGTPALAFKIGVMSGVVGVVDATRTVGQELWLPFNPGDYSTILRPSNKEFVVLPAVSYDRSIGLQVTAAAQAAAPAGAMLRVQTRIAAASNFGGGAGTF
ncbi:hypothetical protein M0D69_13970 [Caballeronia sp. SEWSISQ10-4 2]|uniref:hypothetical protein n=1 Tax=Caballeronia sp. SEWSISQ10-4 2 TaxID=2937438 RepID=UPI00264FF974|nr:hypothetical protein [Caballeronia sp. SEWSISQ10-4 2]MDN7179101.1 hypothetical protein [Caballeronia sp. SEWSISQ10-4 2]